MSVRTTLVNAARGLAKPHGERLPRCGTQQVGKGIAAELSTELRTALEPLLTAVEGLNEQIRTYDRQIEQMAKEQHPEVRALKQVDALGFPRFPRGVGTLIALSYVLTLEDPHRFQRSRDVGCFFGLRPGRRNSGNSQPQMHISKEGDRYLRTLMVQGAHHILGPFGKDCDLRRWGLKLAARGGKNAKKRAIVAVARKLAVLLHRLWVSGEVYDPLRNSKTQAAEFHDRGAFRWSAKNVRRAPVFVLDIGRPSHGGSDRYRNQSRHAKARRPAGISRRCCNDCCARG